MRALKPEMASPRRHTPRVSSRVAAVAGLALLAAVTGVSSVVCLGRDPSVLPSASRFTLGIKHRVFDGVQIDTIILSAPEFAIMTDTFGSWRPEEESRSGPDFILHTDRFPKVRFDICHVSRADAPARDQDWNSYVRRVQRGLGEDATVAEQSDSTKGPPAVSVLGWPTREALFISAAPAGGTAMAERHVLACGGEGAVLFVLSGPLDQLTNADDDFRFFLARLSKY